MYRSFFMDRIWDEVTFVLKPGVDLNAVGDAFTKFYDEYNRIGRPHFETHCFVSDGSVMLHAESGGESYDTVDMYLTQSDRGDYIARFSSGGKNQES